MKSRAVPGYTYSTPGYQKGLSFMRRRMTRLELLGLAGCVVAIVVVLMQVSERLTAGWVAHDSATQFATTVRRAQTIARDRNAYITIRINPASMRHPSQYLIEDSTTVIEQKSFPQALFVAGEATLDPHGVPLNPTSFRFRCCDSHFEVAINEQGVVSMPSGSVSQNH